MVLKKPKPLVADGGDSVATEKYDGLSVIRHVNGLETVDVDDVFVYPLHMGERMFTAHTNSAPSALGVATDGNYTEF